MKSLLFWQTWTRDLRVSYWILWAFLCVAIGLYVTAYWVGSSWAVPTEVQTVVQPSKHTLAEVNLGMFNIPVEGEMFLPEQHYTTSPFTFSIWIYNLYGGILAFCTVLLLSVFTRLKSLWYAVGMTCFILFLSALQLDNLLLFKAGSNFLLLCTLFAYIVLTFCLQAFAKDWAWHWHFLIIGAFTSLLIWYCMVASPLLNPAVFLTNYSLVIPVLVTLVFITMTAHDIPQAFFYLIVKYNREGGTSNIVHIFLITGLYLLHLLLYYFDTTNFLRIGLTFIDTHWLLLIATVLGIWGYKKREPLWGNILPFAPAGAFLYMAMAILSFSTIGFAHLTSNDTLLWVFRDFTLYAYIGFGIVFVLYVVLNFNELIRDGLEVEKVTYEGKLVPYYISRYFALLIVLMFYVAGKQYMYYQIVAAYYNGVGDVYYIHKDRLTAKLNYEKALSNDYLNHHTNYALSDLAAQEENLPERMAYLRIATKRAPLPQTFLLISQTLLDKEQPFPALFALQEGVARFPKSALLHNNLALRYKDKQALDSAFYHLEKAKLYAQDQVAENNFWAILAERKIDKPNLDKLPAITNEPNNMIGRANKLALFTRYGELLTLQPIGKAGKATLENDLNQRLSYTYNYGLNRLGQTDAEVLNLFKALEKADTKGTKTVKIRFLTACYEYYRGNTDAAIQILASLPALEKDPYYNTILGLWLMEQRAFVIADFYFERAVRLGNDREGIFYRAIALSEAGDFKAAAEFWKVLAKPTPREGQKEVNAQDKELAMWATKTLRVIADNATIEDDNDRYNFIHYKRNIAPSATLQDLYAQLKEEKLKAKAGCELIDLLLSKRELAKAMDIAMTLPASKNVTEAIASEMNHAKLRLLAAQQKFGELETQLNKAKLNLLHRKSIAYFRAQIAEDKQDIKGAEKYYLQATLAQPYNEEAIIGVARFFQNKVNDPDKAYQVLVEAVRSNPNSPLLLQAYCEQALIVGLEDYADKAVKDLEKLSEPDAFKAFKALFEKQKEAIAKARGLR